MHPEVLHCRPLLNLQATVQLLPPVTTGAEENKPFSDKYCRGSKRMNLSTKKLIPILVLIISITSILRLLSLTISTSSSSRLSALYLAPPNWSSHLLTCNKVSLLAPGSSNQPSSPPNTTTLTDKEFKILSDLIAQKSPINLLIFGFQTQYLTLSSMNAAGSTVFLEDDLDKMNRARRYSNDTRIYKLEYDMPAKEAYKLLKHARQNPACAPNPRLVQKSKCKLALKYLPTEVYKKIWDVIVIDGPSGDSPESPGRMATIYTASILARAGNISDVVVHDVDRMIEKWFSWEFLCDENLLYSKGKLWHFRIRGRINSTRFCTARVQTIKQ